MNTKSTVSKGTSYETFVQSLYRTLHDSEGFEGVEVQHNVHMKGSSGCEHQIDVYWEFKIAGHVYRTAIECKAFNERVPIGKIRDFYGVLSDIPGLQGIFVTLFGFQSGARRFARHYGINLKEAREPSSQDMAGRISAVLLRCIIVVPEITAIKPNPTKTFLDSFKTEDQLDISFEGSTDDSFVIDSSGNHVASLEEMRQQLPNRNVPEAGLEHTFEYPNCFYNSSTRGRIPIDGVSIRYDVHVEIEDAEIVGEKMAKAIMKDVETGELYFFDLKGSARKVDR